MKNLIRLCFVAIFVLFFAWWLYQGAQVEYPAGPDTGISFGDGTYQLLTGSRDSIYNIAYNSCIIEQVDDLLVRSGKVYVLGSVPQTEDNRELSLYAVITLETNRIELCFLPQSDTAKTPHLYRLTEMLENQDAVLLTDFSDFSEKDRLILQEMEAKQTASP